MRHTDKLLKKLDKAVASYGYVPLSLQYFYKIVGGVNFGWDYDTNENLIWEMADPIQVVSLDDLVDEVQDEYWHESMQEYIADGDTEHAFLELSADCFHKDNISGGPSYALEITKLPAIDGHFMNEPHNTTFIDYLRTCVEYCGFPGIAKPGTKNDYQAFFDKVRPQLRLI